MFSNIAETLHSWRKSKNKPNFYIFQYLVFKLTAMFRKNDLENMKK